MAKSKTEIHVTTVFDGELDATDVFVSLIAQKYSQRNNKEYLVKKQDLGYNKDKVQSDRVPSLNWNPSFQFASLSSDLANRLHK